MITPYQCVKEAVLRKWQVCRKLSIILRSERNSIHGYLPAVQMASFPSRDYFALRALVVLATWVICSQNWRLQNDVTGVQHPRKPTQEDWRRRLLALAARGARSAASGSIAAAAPEADEVRVLVPDPDGEVVRRAAAAILRELESGLPGFAFALGRSRRRATRRCSRRMSSRGTRTALSWRSRRPAPISCSSRT